MPIRRILLPSGLRIACQDVGPFQAPSGRPPLVLLHGVGADSAEWLLTLPFLARRRRVVAIDLLGHGRSDKPSGHGVDYRLRLLGETSAGALDGLPSFEGPIDLLGHSLGGAVAIQIALLFPRLVRRLILVDAAGLPPAQALSLHAISLPFAPRTYAESRRLLSTAVRSPLLNNALVAFGAAVYKGRRRNRPQLLKLLAAIAAGEDAVPVKRLSRIHQPTLVLWGDKDLVFPVATGRRMAEALPNGRLEIIPRCGHVPPTERPIAFVRRVEAFLSE